MSAQAQSGVVDKDFYKDLDSFLGQHVKGKYFDYKSVKDDPTDLLELLKIVDNAQIGKLSEDEQLAFYINAYNLSVLKTIVLNFPVASTNEITGFFDKKEHKIAKQYITLDYLENSIIRKEFDQPLIHFALNCGAKGCPPLISEAYRPEKLETQLNSVATSGLNDPNWVRIEDDQRTASLSPIFDWFAEDFGGNKKSIFNFINKYREVAIPASYQLSHYPYDWDLNSFTNVTVNTDLPTNSSANASSGIAGDGSFRYIVAALYDRGEYEINIFNNLFYSLSDHDGTDYTSSSTFYSLLGQFLYGINPRLNVGFDIRLRSVESSQGERASRFNALSFPSSGFTENGYTRTGLSAFGPRIKYAPFRNYGNISVQHTLYIPFGKNLQSKDGLGFLDWDGFTFLTQFFYDQQIGSKFGLFAEADLHFENIDGKVFGGEEGTYYQISTPLTLIGSWYANKSVTVYGLMGSAPQWGFSLQSADVEGNRSKEILSNPFSQYGLGFKYLFGTRLQAEVLFTSFHNGTGKKSSTMNFGLRYIAQ